MRNLIKAEHLKLRHTFGGKISIIAPCLMLMLSLVLAGGTSFAAGAWNWWYSMFLPGTLSIACYLSMKKDKVLKYQNLLLLNIPPQKSWNGKVLYCALGLLISNAVLYLGTLLGGALFETTIPAFGGLYAVFLLTAACLWEVPLFLFLSARFGMFLSIFASVVLSVGGVLIAQEPSFWWLCPSAIPSRLMCPVLGLLPNGLLVPVESALNSPNVILPGIALSMVWFLAVDAATSVWFAHWEGRA